MEKGDVIQIVTTHRWGGCLAIVDEPKSFGCQAYISIPDQANVFRVYIHLNRDEYEQLGVKAPFIIE